MRYLIICLSVIAFSISCNHSLNKHYNYWGVVSDTSKVVTAGLQMSLKALDSIPTNADELTMKIILKNISERPFYIKKTKGTGNSGDGGNIEINIIPPKNVEVIFTMYQLASLPVIKATDFVLLKPNEKYIYDADLSFKLRDYNLEGVASPFSPGKYYVSAYYKNKDFIDIDNIHKIWLGEIKANMISFDIY